VAQLCQIEKRGPWDGSRAGPKSRMNGRDTLTQENRKTRAREENLRLMVLASSTIRIDIHMFIDYLFLMMSGPEWIGLEREWERHDNGTDEREITIGGRKTTYLLTQT